MANRRWPCSFAAVFLLCFLFLESGVTPLVSAEAVSPALQHRGTFIGGYAIAEQQCPSGAISCPSDNYCCPAGTACKEYAFVGYCCPSETDCLPTLRSFPTCADPSWVMYQGKGTGDLFCCEAGQQGIYPSHGEGGVGFCVASDMTFAVTQTASLYSTASGTSPTASAATSTTGASTASTTGTTHAGSQSASQANTLSATTSSTGTSATTSATRSAGSRGRADLSLIQAVGAVGITLVCLLW